MKPTSDAWSAACRSGFTPTVRAEVWRDGEFVDVLPVVAGTYSSSESSLVRSNVSLTLATDLATDAFDLLRLEDTDVRVWAGMIRTDGASEEVSDIWGRVQSVRRSGVLSGIEITVDDYMSVIAGARFVRPWSTPSGKTVVAEITSMLQDVDPSIEVIDASGLYPPPRTSVATWDRERAQAIQTLASSIGCEVFFDGDRVAIIRPVPVPTGDPVWTAVADVDDANLTDLAIGADSPGYNAVTATSSASADAPVSATAYAPSYRAGVKRPRFYASPQLTTQAQCMAAASGILVRSLRFSRSVSPRAIPDYSLEVGDVGMVSHASIPEELRVLTAIQRPYGPAGDMSMDTRVSVEVTVQTGDLEQ